MTTTFDKAKLIPPAMQTVIANGGIPLYKVNRPDLDRLPLYTFLIGAMMGTNGQVIESVVRIVKPNDPRGYELSKLTKDKRLLYVSWWRGHAARSLYDAKMSTWQYVVMPDEPGHETLEAFKAGCDLAHAAKGPSPFSPALLYRALGLDAEQARRLLAQAREAAGLT